MISMRNIKNFTHFIKLITSAGAFLISVIPMSCQQYQPSGMIENKEYDKKLFHMLDHDVPVIGVEELNKNIDTYQLLDVRTSEEYEISHIQGALNVDYDNFEVNAVSQIDEASPIVVYCSVG